MGANVNNNSLRTLSGALSVIDWTATASPTANAATSFFRDSMVFHLADAEEGYFAVSSVRSSRPFTIALSA